MTICCQMGTDSLVTEDRQSQEPFLFRQEGEKCLVDNKNFTRFCENVFSQRWAVQFLWYWWGIWLQVCTLDLRISKEHRKSDGWRQHVREHWCVPKRQGRLGPSPACHNTRFFWNRYASIFSKGKFINNLAICTLYKDPILMSKFLSLKIENIF